MYAVADGMGGHRGGEVASQLALTTIAESFRKGAVPFADQVQAANRAVFERAGADRNLRGHGDHPHGRRGPRRPRAPGARGRLARVPAAGGCPAATDGRSHAGEPDGQSGEITAAEAEVHPHRNVLVRALGTEPDVPLDERDVGLLDGDRLLLCSDGLTGMLTEDQIQAILESTPKAPQEAADRLVVAANRAGVSTTSPWSSSTCCRTTRRTGRRPRPRRA